MKTADPNAPTSPSDLSAAQRETLAAPRRRYGLLARILFATVGTIYGKSRSLETFRVLEIVARVPYQAWENVGYVAITHTHERVSFARRVFDYVAEARAQQDNEQWHLLIVGLSLAKVVSTRERFRWRRSCQRVNAFAGEGRVNAWTLSLAKVVSTREHVRCARRASAASFSAASSHSSSRSSTIT